MNILVSSIARVSMKKIALWIYLDVDDWTAKKAIIVSNDFMRLCNKCALKCHFSL